MIFFISVSFSELQMVISIPHHNRTNTNSFINQDCVWLYWVQTSENRIPLKPVLGEGA